MVETSAGLLADFIETELSRGIPEKAIASECARIIVTESQSGEPQIEPLLVLALAHVESGYRPRATSPVGALGLLQIMPATGAMLAFQLKISSAEKLDLYDPVVNARLGIHYLKTLYKQFRFDWNDALTAYNRGPGNTEAILKKHGSLPGNILESYANLVLRTFAKNLQAFTQKTKLG